MTIYLIHGFVMWTWGAWVAIALNPAGVPYWVNLIINFFFNVRFDFLVSLDFDAIVGDSNSSDYEEYRSVDQGKASAKKENDRPIF